MLATANDNFAQVVLTRVAQNGFIFLRIGEGRGFRPQLLGQAQRTEDRATLVFWQGVKLRRFDIHRMPDAAKFRSQPGGGTDKLFIAATVTNAQQDGIPRMPDAFLSLQIAPGTHLVIHAIGGAAQGQFAQGNQVAFTKEVFDSAFGLACNIDFPFMQALAQIVWRQVHQHYFISGVKERIRHRFAHLNAGHAADHVVQAFKMLNIHRGEDVNPGFK